MKLAIFFVFAIALTTIAEKQLCYGTNREVKKKYDFVVVGSGPGGIIAFELASAGYSVLLLERGGNTSNSLPLILQQGDVRNPGFNPEIIRPHYSLEDKVRGTRGIYFPTAFGAGGGSKIAYGRQHVFGDARIYDEFWGAEWNYASMLPYFIKTENFTREDGNIVDTTAHGINGKVYTFLENTFNVSQWSVPTQALINTFSLDGIGDDPNNLPNGPENKIYPGVRSFGHDPTNYTPQDIWDKIIFPAIPTLHKLCVALNSTVLRLVTSLDNECDNIPSNDPEIHGVKYMFRDKLTVVCHRNKTILAAGPIFTPAILQRSGIGNADHLTNVGIPILYHNPNVGQNLLNQYLIRFSYTANSSSCRPPGRGIIMYLCSQSSYDTACNFTNTILTIRGDQETGNPGTISLFDSTSAIYPNIKKGSVNIISSDLLRDPIVSFSITPNGVNGPELQPYVYLISHLLDLTSNFPLDSNCIWTRTNPPLSTLPDNASESQIRSFVFSVTNGFLGSGWHFGGTAKLGDVDDSTAVVDRKCNVIGVKNLVIGDLSVIPALPNAHTNSIAEAIGYKVADIILYG